MDCTPEHPNALTPVKWGDQRLPGRFWSKVVANLTTGCWEWRAGRCRDGYGTFAWKGGTAGAHRLAFTQLVGDVPSTLALDHLCRVRHCVNPAHLEPVSHRVNILRSPIAPAALNALKTHCVNGHELVGGNVRTDRRGKRVCRPCASDAMARFHARQASLPAA